MATDKLPPLPEPASINGVPGYTADQVRAPQWQPIETAPTDHFPRLLRVRGLTMQGFRDVAGHWNIQTETPPHWRKLRGKPTHWMPLPEAPAKEGGGNDGRD